jgi:hypothetical protein
MQEREADPSFRFSPLNDYGRGITVIRSAQYPYSVKNVMIKLLPGNQMLSETT